VSEPITVTGHYGTSSLLTRVEDALRRAGLEGKQLAWTDLIPLDQFHTRGHAATKELAAALAPKPGETILDIGAGLGGPARFLAATYACDVTGIDLSQPFVDVATMLTARANLSSQVRFQQADAVELPFPDESFDHAWTQHVAMNIADRGRLYAAIARVLRPGGRLAIYDVVAGDAGPPHFPLPWARVPEISFLLTPNAMREALSVAGFAPLSWEDKTTSAIAWFAEQRATRPAPSALGLPVVMGPEFPAMAANLGRNLAEGRVRIVQAVLQRNG